MKGVIVLNGEACDYDFNESSFIVACDGGFEYLKKRKITPNLILGDFDSLGYIPNNAKAYPVEKDFTDGELALNECLKQNIKDIDFICAGGGREDHFLGNLSLVNKACSEGCFVKLITVNSIIYCTNNPIYLSVNKNVIISVVAIEDSFIENSSGLKYPFINRIIKKESTLGISNIATSDKVFLNIQKGRVFVIVNRNII